VDRHRDRRPDRGRPVVVEAVLECQHQEQSYGTFSTEVKANQVATATVNNDTGHITFTDLTGKKFTVSGPTHSPTPPSATSRPTSRI